MNHHLSFRGIVVCLLLACYSAPALLAGDQELVETYLKDHAVTGFAIRPVTGEFISRAFPGYSFFGVSFRQYPIAAPCPESAGLQCANLFFVKDEQVDVVSTIDGLKFFFTVNLNPAPDQDSATDAASSWLRFSEELKQDSFYTFSAPVIAYTPRVDVVLVRATATVTAGGDGAIDVLMNFGAAGSFLGVLEKSALRAGIRPICQATKLLDSDPIVRRMAEQDILVMGRTAKPYLDHIRPTVSPELQQAIDRIWQRILREGR